MKLLTALLLFLMCLSGCTKDTEAKLKASLQKGLMAYYPFNGNANDESGNNNDGTVNGATLTTDRYGRANSAYSFNGIDNKITIADDATLNFHYITVSLWYQTNNTSETQYFLYKSEWADASNEEYAFGINYWKESQIVAGIKKSSVCQPGAGWQRTFMNNGSTQWHHYVFTYDGTKAIVYFDGALKTTNTSISGPIDVCAGGTLTIGAGWNGDPGWWSGKIDDVMIYNRALSATEVKVLRKIK